MLGCLQNALRILGKNIQTTVWQIVIDCKPLTWQIAKCGIPGTRICMNLTYPILPTDLPNVDVQDWTGVHLCSCLLVPSMQSLQPVQTADTPISGSQNDYLMTRVRRANPKFRLEGPLSGVFPESSFRVASY